MSEKFAYPEVTVKSEVVSSDYHCGDAVLVKVNGGTGAFAFESLANGYAVSINGQSIFSVNEDDFCPTCGGMLYRGYGHRNLSMEEVMQASEQVNGPYTGIHAAVEAMGPLLGLLETGYYMVADYELFPFIGETFFWNCTQIPEMFTAWGHVMGLEHYAVTTCPANMIPSQSANRCDPARIEHYIRRLPERDGYPRAIGLYLSGNSVLLLDGHHKAAAAAAKGKMVKCLVIMPAQVPEQIGFQTLLHHGRQLLDDAGKAIASTRPFLSQFGDEAEEKRVAAPDDLADWGSIPAEFMPDPRAFKDVYHQEFKRWLWYGNEDARRNAEDDLWGAYDRWTKDSMTKGGALELLRWHQAQFDRLTQGENPAWKKPLLRKQQWSGLNRAAKKYGIDRDPKTANLVYGVFSFLPGQRKITDIPAVLAHKLQNEVIRTVLIPNSVREVDMAVFDSFPDLENIVLEKGNPKLRQETYRALSEELRRKREADRHDELHLRQYPFADLADRLKKKRENQ